MDAEAYDALDVKRTYTNLVPVYARGKKYNRYYDILPNPLTRVVLPPIPNVPEQAAEESTYINANYVRGFGG